MPRNNGLTASDTIKLRKIEALTTFKRLNPDTPDMGKKGQSANTLLLREAGDILTDCGCTFVYPVCEFPTDYPNSAYFPFNATPGGIADVENLINGSYGLVQTVNIPGPPAGYDTDIYAILIAYLPVCNATTYSEAIYDIDGFVPLRSQTNLGLYATSYPDPSQIGFLVLYPARFYSIPPRFEFTASNSKSSETQESVFGGCFVAGAKVSMSDRSLKSIEDVKVGDRVIGAFGEINTVLALHRPILGFGRMININNEHKTTSHHPHIGADKSILAVDCELVPNTFYGKDHKVINAKGVTEIRTMVGLNSKCFQPLVVGKSLQTVSGPKPITTIETVSMSPFTQLYHLVVSGSHSFCVDGYAVLGWADETDFNYDTWMKR